MTDVEFTKLMEELASAYPGNPYPPVRVGLIWKEVQSLPRESFKKIVEQLIGKYQRPPMIPEICELVSIERERHWEREKSLMRRDAKEFMTRLSDSEISAIVGTITKRIKGNDGPGEWEAFDRMMDTLVSQAG